MIPSSGSPHNTMWQIVISRGALEGTLSRLVRTIEKSPCNHPSEPGLVRNTPKIGSGNVVEEYTRNSSPRMPPRLGPSGERADGFPSPKGIDETGDNPCSKTHQCTALERTSICVSRLQEEGFIDTSTVTLVIPPLVISRF